MAASGESSGARAVCEDEARRETERLLSDSRLHVSERHRAFLKYITDALFEGRTESVKAYSIAIDVFNRPASFDPSSDPIVRIEATRLRETLQKYYEELGNEPGARLDIPRGRYVPVFVERDHPPCPLEGAADREDPGSSADVPLETIAAVPVEAPGPVSRWHYIAAGLIGLCVVGLGGYGIVTSLAPTHLKTQKPFVALSMNTSPKDGATSEAVMEGLAISLARFGTVRLRSQSFPERTGADVAPQTSYQVKLRYAEDSSGVSIWWQVSNGLTGEAIWTDEERRALNGSRSEAFKDLVYGVSRKLAGPSGIINAAELRRNLPLATTGNVCVLRGELAVEMRDPAGLKASVSCLGATIAADPSDADAMATFARVMLWSGRTTGDDSYFRRGLDMAKRAAAISPNSPRAALAQMAMLYQVGQNDSSKAAGRRGVALNPENAELLAKLSMVVFLSGDWKEGVELAQKAAEVAGQPIRDASFVMILDAYRQGNFAQAVFLARQVPAADTPTAVLKLAAIARIGDRSVTEREIGAARLQHPDLDRTVAAMFAGARYDDDLEAALWKGIQAAGLKTPEFASNGAM